LILIAKGKEKTRSVLTDRQKKRNHVPEASVEDKDYVNMADVDKDGERASASPTVPKIVVGRTVTAYQPVPNT